MNKEITPLDEEIENDLYKDGILDVRFVKNSIQNLQKELKEEFKLIINKGWFGYEIIDKAFLKHIGKGLLK